MIGVEHARWSRLPGETAFRTDHGDDLAQTDAGGRVSLVLDLRDREFLTTKGLLAEAGMLFGGGGEDRDGDVISRGSYAGWYAHLRGYASPRSGTLVAGRLAARLVDRVAPLSARTTLPGWEDGVDALGGAYAHRSFIPGRLSGRGLLLGSVRQNLMWGLRRSRLIVFGDAEESSGTSHSFRPPRDGRLGRARPGVLPGAHLQLAGGPDGFVFPKRLAFSPAFIRLTRSPKRGHPTDPAAPRSGGQPSSVPGTPSIHWKAHSWSCCVQAAEVHRWRVPLRRFRESTGGFRLKPAGLSTASCASATKA
jgi:hypothetical protein